MEFLNNLITQLKTLWQRWTIGQRAGLLGAAVASVAAVAAVGFYATSPEYVFLTDHLTPQRAAEIVSVLESESIPYKLSYSGSAISVSRSQLGPARLALKDLVNPPTAQSEELDSGLWTDPSVQQNRINRQLENRLAQSVMQLSSVRNATVHITHAENSPFIRDRAPAKASVILDLQSGNFFSQTDARSIVSLVAHSVEHLDPENVTVVDTAGRLLSSEQGLEADVSGQLDYRTRVEADLASKAQSILTQMLGPGRAVVRVTADIDFTETQRKETKYDPEGKVKLSETIHSESRDSGSKSQSGKPGVKANTDPLEFQSGGSSGAPGSKVESNTTTFENAKTEDVVREVPGRIKRLTVAAVVQLADPDADNAQAGGAAVTQEQVQKIIQQAIGFDPSRQDAIEVLVAPLQGIPELAIPAAPSGFQKYESLLRTMSLGIAAVVALLLGGLLLRKMKPIVVQSESRETLSSDVVLRIAELAQQVKSNPEAAATVIRSWMQIADEQPQQKRKVA